MKIYQGQQGQLGDAIISLRVSEELKKQFPDAEIVTGTSKQYSSINSLLSTASYINRVIEWDGYCHYTDKDKLLLEQEKFDLFFCPFEPSAPEFWRNHHQVAEAFSRHGLCVPSDLQVHLPPLLPARLQSIYSYPIVTVSFFPNYGKGIKCLSIDKAQQIVDYLNFRKCVVVQMDGEVILKNIFNKASGNSWIDTAKWLSSTNLHIGTDTSTSWLASAYNTSMLGLYAFGYYQGAETSKNWQPINPNALYLEEYAADDINIDLIKEKIDYLLQVYHNQI